ncbi:MAG: diguanylate cyclase [Acidobacteriales bacterium]|nr:diguanylate cyclase [Terriglobales bacterium]
MKILIAAKDDDQERLWNRTLSQEGFVVSTARDTASAMRALQKESAPTLAVFGPTALDVCSRLRTMTADRYVYCIAVLDSETRQARDKAFEAGADDVIASCAVRDELPARLRLARRVLHLQEQLLTAREALRFESTHDGTTGAFNRQGMGDHLRREFERATRFGKSLGVIIVDVDHFRIINESFGYGAGDRVFREVAQRIQNSVRAYDIVGRYGADEFVVLSPESTAVAMMAQAERILTSLSSIPVTFDGQQILLTASVGVAMSDERSATELLQAAEDAVKQAKLTGRNSVEFARSSATEVPFSPVLFDPGFRVN